MKQSVIRNAVAASVAAVGLVIGAVGVSQAATDPSASASSSANTQQGAVADHHGGHHFGGPESAALAKALGVSQDALDKAMQQVREELKPATKPTTPPTEAQMAQHQTDLINALAKKLNLDPAKVKAAFDQVQADRRAQERTNLNTRLSDAVTAGKLTAADQASVLKAFDAGVLGGGPRAFGGPGMAPPAG